jgi:hypothetical protein
VACHEIGFERNYRIKKNLDVCVAAARLVQGEKRSLSLGKN